MSLLSYQLSVKKYQKELGLTDRDFNKLDYEHSNINLLKQLQILNPVASAPPANTGWYGTLTITNSGVSQSAMYIINFIRDDTNIDAIYPGFITLQAGEPQTFTLTQAQRLATSQTKFNIYWEGDESGNTTIESITGLTLVNYDTGYEPFNSALVRANYTVDSAYINQAIQLTIEITAP